VPGNEGTSGILDDTGDHIYVEFPSDTGVSAAPTAVSVIHKGDPAADDVVAFNPAVMSVWPYATAAAMVDGSHGYALFTVFPGSPPPERTAFREYISSRTQLMAIAGAASAGHPRVSHNDWRLYGNLTFYGSPGGPSWYPTPEAVVEAGHLVMRLGGKTVFVDQAPPTLASGPAPRTVWIVAANREFLVSIPLGNGPENFSAPNPAILYVHNRQANTWREIRSRGNMPQCRIFGRWLATRVMTGINPASVGIYRDTNPGHKDESNVWVKYERPNVREEFDSLFYRIPGIFTLDNLSDGRRITLKTHEEDSEILDVRKDGLVLYRVNDEIFSAKIEGDNLGPSKLVVKGEDVPEVHWAFWSNAQPKASAPSPHSPGQKPPITLRLEAPKKPLKAGERLLLRAKLTNISDHKIGVGLTAGEALPMGLIYQVYVCDQRGHTLPRRPPPPPPPHPKGTAVVSLSNIGGVGLNPGQSVIDRIPITSYYDLNRPGKYSIWIRDLPSVAGYDVKSNVVIVTVVK
jgi:hypothetical protein